MTEVLGPKFFQRNTTEVARRLLGCTLVHRVGRSILSGRIVETEAYLGIEDRACHSFGGRRTERLTSMYLEGGHSYVYLIYGMHWCFNVVTRSEAHPEAVLIRAIEPLDGIEIMRKNRGFAKRDRDLTSGPGKLCQALKIGKAQDRLPLQKESGLYILRGSKIAEQKIVSAPRIGVDYAGEASQWHLRFYIQHNPFVSKI